MKITEIEVRAAMTLPTRQFANVRPECCIRATLEPGEDHADAISRLQGLCNLSVKVHAEKLTKTMEEICTK